MSTLPGSTLGKNLYERVKEFERKMEDVEYEKNHPSFKPKSKEDISSRLVHAAHESLDTLFNQLNTSHNGISHSESAMRIRQYGHNEIAHDKRSHWFVRLFKIIRNPLILLLIAIILVSIFTDDMRTMIVVSLMVSISVILRFIQEEQAYSSAESLKSMVRTTCTVIRNGKGKETDLKDVVPGDIVELAAGDIIPADVRLIESNELYVNQSSLTGEALPVDKHATVHGTTSEKKNPLELANICFMGTNVESGHAYAVVVQTGSHTYFGALAKTIAGQRAKTSFDKGIDKFTWLMIGFMAIMVPTVFLVNGLTKGNWLEALLFGVAIAVGLTPEMLPAIVTVNLSKGSITMSKKKVIIKRLSSIQNFGAMNVLCTDKTGTLTENKIVLIDNLNIKGETDLNVLHFAYVNSHFQTGFKNLLDTAVLKHAKKNNVNNIDLNYIKIDELPFDFKRKRLTVIVENKKNEKLVICKGAVEETLSICAFYEINGREYHLDREAVERIQAMNEKFSKEGFRVLAVAHQHIAGEYAKNVVEHEKDLVFSGLMTFFDPPKQSASEALTKLEKYGVQVKVLTGDNDLVTKKIAEEVGITVEGTLLGHQIEAMSPEDLQIAVGTTTIFAKLSPDHKRKVVEAIKKSDHVVGFLGDGINDAPALRAADVGISVNNAVDIARESADIILLELSLNVLVDGVIEGRKVFGNIIKYIKMGASSNFGNMFSVIGASVFLPFLPMLPSQILANNLLYDISQTAIPLDNVDEEYIEKPRKWQIDDIGRFMIFIGPISSIFDYATFFIMLFVFNAWSNPSLFQTGWFVESLASQTLIVHIIRSKKMPFFQTWASRPLTAMTFTIIAAGILLTFSPLAPYFSFVRLPLLYWPLLIIMLISYVILTQIVKTWYIRKFGYN